jgi:hypothetical protein
MSLVLRGSRPYYYKSFRKDGRVTSRYVASGQVAEAMGWLDADTRARNARQQAKLDKQMAALDARSRALDAKLRQAWLIDQASALAVDDLLVRWCAAVEGVFREAMAAAGCHQHKRMWRKRRMDINTRIKSERRIQDLWNRIASGDPSAYRHVKLAFDGAPDESIEAGGGNLAARVVEGLTDRLAGKHLYRREAITRKLAKVRADFEGPNPSPGERLLAERAAVCWLATYEADLTCMNRIELTDVKLANFYEKRRERAQRRFESAMRALAVLRRLALPTVRGRAAGVKSKARSKAGGDRATTPTATQFGDRLAEVGAAERN